MSKSLRLRSFLAPAVLLSACATSSVDANRRLWQGFLDESEPGTRSVAAFDEAGLPRRAAEAKDREPLGLSILANEVLGREIPERTEVVTNACLCGLAERTPSRARRSAEPKDVSALQETCRAYVFSNFAPTARSDEGLEVETKRGDFVPRRLRETDFLKEYVNALVSREGATDPESSSISRSDVMEFGEEAYRLSADHEEAGKTTVGRLLRMYLAAYIRGDFVDRLGRRFAKPSILNPIGGDKPIVQIGNDVIANFAAITLEAITDAAFGTPILVESDGSYFTTDKPTLAVLFGAVERVQTDPSVPGITELEREMILYVSNLAGTKSRLLSSLVFGFLSEAEIELVVGAHFAFGDNDTLKILLDTLFEVGARNLTEHFAYKGLSHFEYTIDSGGHVMPAEGDDKSFGRVIAFLLQEQELLRRLLPKDG